MIQVHADAEALSRAAAELFAAQAQQAVAARGRFVVSLSGGSTPKRVYELLAQSPLREQIPWKHVHLFWGDERCVSADDPRSNYHMTRLALLDHVPIPKEQVHPIDGTATPEESAKQYETLLKSFFTGGAPRFDLVLLGLGGNGHTASLFPHTFVLNEKAHWVRDVDILQVKIEPIWEEVADPRSAFLREFIKELERAYEIEFSEDEAATIKSIAQPITQGLSAVAQKLQKKQQVLERVTMTAPLLNQAAVLVFLVAGAGKAEVVRDVIEGPSDPQRLPAQLIHPTSGELRWLLDRAAAAKLRNPASERC